MVEIVAYFAVQMVLDRWGRRLTYCLFVVALSFVAILVIPIQMFVPKDSTRMRFFFSKFIRKKSEGSTILDQYVLMFIVNIALKFLASGSYVIIYIYANETFPTQGRNTGMGVCSMIARVGAILGTFSNDHLVK